MAQAGGERFAIAQYYRQSARLSTSYNSPYAWAAGEHPNLHEPVGGHEAQLREEAAASFVAKKYGTFLQQWLKACPCWCDSK